MNIEQAKRIPLAEILDKLGCHRTQQKNTESWYLSPFRNEKTASFKVNHTRNVWYDHGQGIGGDTVGLVCLHLRASGEHSTVSDALRWLTNMMGYATRIEPIDNFPPPKRDGKLKKLSVTALSSPALIRYLGLRGIPLELADRYLKQVRVENNETGKKFDVIGFRNEDGGYELRSAFFKGGVGKKYITFIRGNIVKPPAVHIFEGWPDYLSALVRQNGGKNFDDDAIILNSLSFLTAATPFIKGYGYSFTYSWMDNDEAGTKAIKSLDDFLKTEDQLTHVTMNHLYARHKDVNAWHMAALGLSL